MTGRIPAILFLLSLSLLACDSSSTPPAAATTAPSASEVDLPVPFCEFPPTQEQRISEAQRLLAEAGYPGGKDFPSLEILYNTDEGHKKIAAALQQMWRKNLGIDAQVRNTEWKVYLDDMSKLRYQIVRRGWIGDYRDPNTFIEMFTSHSGNNNTGWKNEEFDALVKAAVAEPDAAKRLASLRKAEQILLREAPIAPLYFYVSTNVWKKNVTGVFPNILDVHPLHEVRVEGKDELVINNATEVQTLDPGLARGVPEHRILSALFEGLTTPDPKTLEPRPGAAEKWELSPDGRTYTFHLRDAKWSDGKPVTAGDFVYSWRRILDPATPTDYAHQLYYLKGAEDFNQKKTADPETIGVRATDDRTLVVELVHPCHFFLELLSHFTYYPVRRDLLEKHGTNWTKPGNLAGNGPFRLASWEPTVSIIVERNPEYWNAGVVKQPRVKFLPIENRSTSWSLYEEGSCDWVTTIPLEHVDQIVQRPDYHGDTYLGTYFYSFNVTVPPLNDVRVRRALALAIDRDILVTKITKKGEKPAYSITPPAWPEYTSPRIDQKE